MTVEQQAPAVKAEPFYEGDLVTLYRANALDLPLEDDSVDLVVTSPPYFGLRSYTDGGEHYQDQVGAEATPTEYLDALIAATREMMRVVKPTGSIWVNLGDKYAGGGMGGYSKGDGRGGSLESPHRGGSYETYNRNIKPGVRSKSLIGIPWRYAIRCMDELGLILRQEIIWAKPNAMPEPVKDRAKRSHEQWFHFTMQPKYYADLDAVREAYTSAPAKAQKSKATTLGIHKNPTTLLEHDLKHNPKGKIPSTVRNVPTEPLKIPKDLGIDHFAAFPTEWPRWIISGWSPPGGVVLDPFGGTGTTALVASVLGRHGISVDLSSDYCRLAQWRVTDPGQQERVQKKVAKVEAERAAGWQG